MKLVAVRRAPAARLPADTDRVRRRQRHCDSIGNLVVKDSAGEVALVTRMTPRTPAASCIGGTGSRRPVTSRSRSPTGAGLEGARPPGPPFDLRANDGGVSRGGIRFSRAAGRERSIPHPPCLDLSTCPGSAGAPVFGRGDVEIEARDRLRAAYYMADRSASIRNRSRPRVSAPSGSAAGALTRFSHAVVREGLRRVCRLLRRSSGCGSASSWPLRHERAPTAAAAGLGNSYLLFVPRSDRGHPRGPSRTNRCTLGSARSKKVRRAHIWFGEGSVHYARSRCTRGTADHSGVSGRRERKRPPAITANRGATCRTRGAARFWRTARQWCRTIAALCTSPT